ncbi:MAG TPA: flagellar basal body-associated protein FliL, partial [Halomonas sp.]|nr:flagellar basal body-associated protein FliL [Halomonas sp.]
MAESSGGSKKLLWVMIILVLLSSAGAAAAIYLVLDQRDSGEVQQQTVELTPPVFTRIEPFTVNLADDRYGSRLLYTGITLRVGNEQSKTIIEEHMPQVRSRLLIL